MIIAYYPGAGGNRFLRRMTGNDWTHFNKSYDSHNPEQSYEHRYLTDPVAVPRSDHALTHCMNSQQIQHCFPTIPVVFIRSDLQASLRREWILHGHQRYIDRAVKNTVSRLEHYYAIKDPAWPEISIESEIDQLPNDILQEVISDYRKIINDHPAVPDSLVTLTQSMIDRVNSAYEIICWHKQYYTTYPVDFSAAHQVVDIDNDDNEFSQLMQKELSLYQSEIFDQVWKSVNEQG
jgi:hypothetical protein